MENNTEDDKIKEYIKIKAKEFAGRGSVKNYIKNHHPKTYDDRVDGYCFGMFEGFQIMIAFYNILTDEFDEYAGGKWEVLTEARADKWQLQYETFYTTIELLEKYLNHGK